MVSSSGICAKRVVVDALHHMLGRLASILAKELLNGQRVVVVRCEEICLSGGLVRQKMKYLRLLRILLLRSLRRRLRKLVELFFLMLVEVWDLDNFQCLETLRGHNSAVTSLLCWDKFLLSGSLDNTLKVWAATESGNLEVVYELKEESGILAFCGIHDAEAKPILLCSCKDNSVRLYDLPSFAERGRIFAKRDVYSLQIGCGGLFFTGDETGRLSVWKLLGESTAVPS